MLNQKITHFIKSHSAQQSPIVMADQHSGFILSEDLAEDGILPNEKGAQKMAEVFSVAINSLLNHPNE